jgi:hypothetical protein
MSEKNSGKIFMAFVAGAAIGAALGYFLNSSKKDELVADLKEGATNLKQGFDDSLGKAKDIIDTFRGNTAEAESDSQPKS